MNERFTNLSTSPVFKNIGIILDVSTWPRGEINMFGDGSVLELGDAYEELLLKNGCDINELIPEWNSLKVFVLPIIHNNQSEFYIKIWEQVFKSSAIKEECSNILHIIEILLITMFTNTKLERMFSRMNRVKTDYRNRLA